MPAALPSHTTRQPRACIQWATASPGNTCPPVPPAITISVRELDAPDARHTFPPRISTRFS